MLIYEYKFFTLKCQNIFYENSRLVFNLPHIASQESSLAYKKRSKLKVYSSNLVMLCLSRVPYTHTALGACMDAFKRFNT